MFSLLAKSLVSDAIAHLPKLSENDNEKMAHELQAAFQRQLDATLAKAQLVSKTEFDAQSKTLQRLQKKIDALENQVAELEDILKK